MSAHTLTIRPLPGVGDGWAKTSHLEVLLDGKPLEGVTRIEVAPMDAFGGLVHVQLHMIINPDFELPADITIVTPETEQAEA